MYDQLTTDQLRAEVRRLYEQQREISSKYAHAARSLKRRLKEERCQQPTPNA